MLKGEGDGDSLRATVEEAIKEACCDDALPKLAGALRSSPDARVLCQVGGVSMLLRRLGAEPE